MLTDAEYDVSFVCPSLCPKHLYYVKRAKRIRIPAIW